jgi:hypothetical protein
MSLLTLTLYTQAALTPEEGLSMPTEYKAWMGSRAALDIFKYRKLHFPCRKY